MSCKPEVIETIQVNNENVSYRIVCCGEKCGSACRPDAHKCEDSRITLHLDTDHDPQLEEYKAKVAARHTKMKAWREKHGK